MALEGAMKLSRKLLRSDPRMIGVVVKGQAVLLEKYPTVPLASKRSAL
jgi:hypothetical protein